MGIDLRLYNRLSRVRWLRSYSSKFFFIAFIGMNLPLLGTIALLAYTKDEVLPEHTVFAIALAFTFLATIASVLLMKKLLNPVKLLRESLDDFMHNEKLPSLPQGYNDEIGILMRNMQEALINLHFVMETKNDIIEIISHDMRSPAFSMLGLIDLLENMRSDDNELMEYLSKLRTLSHRQISLTNDVITSLRQEEKFHTLEKSPVKIAPVIDTIIRSFDALLTRKQLILKMDIPENLCVYCDSARMHEVISNLVDNAIKFSYHNGMITISAVQDNGRTRIIVKDEGAGLENIKQDQLFKRFTKYSRPGTDSEESSGLGLFICKKIVEKHGGRLSAFSEGTDKGCTFTIELPSQPCDQP
jgi:signal transduction histidine kinase